MPYSEFTEEGMKASVVAKSRGGYLQGDDRSESDLPEIKRELLMLTGATEGVRTKLESLTRHLGPVSDSERMQKYFAQAEELSREPVALDTRTQVGFEICEISRLLNRVSEQLDALEMAVSL